MSCMPVEQPPLRSLRSRVPLAQALEQYPPPAPHASRVSGTSSLVTIPPNNLREGAISRIENLLEAIIDAISDGVELVIPYKTARSSAAAPEDRQADVRFPGRTSQEAKKFEALFRIIELAHEALLSGNLITKRNIYYQNVELFKSQGAVDDMVDHLASTLGLGRGDLNIVAAAKGLISGPVDLFMRGGDIIRCTQPPDGLLLPTVQSIEKIDFGKVKWLLVIEKEATFRTLAAAQYPIRCNAGPGILVTAKGFPDLATRRFLHVLHSIRPELRMSALVDFDPHGISILRTYRNGSKRLDHEVDLNVSHMRWLGIRSDDIISRHSQVMGHPSSLTESQSSQAMSSQDSGSYSHNGKSTAIIHPYLPAHSLVESPGRRPSKRPKLQRTRDPGESILPLTPGDRKKAVDVMKEIYKASGVGVDEDATPQLQELQKMLMLNVKAEIQAVDNFGDITEWLDERLSI